MKRIFLLLTTMMLSCMTVYASADKPLTAADIANGTYDIEVTSSSSMFRIVKCELNVSDSGMEAVMTLSGTGYEKLYMGTGEEAATADESEYIYFVENDEGQYTYTVPVKALNTETDCAAWSIRKQQWYDRTLVFESGLLPESAFVKSAGFNAAGMIACAAAALIVGIAIAVVIKKKKANN